MVEMLVPRKETRMGVARVDRSDVLMAVAMVQCAAEKLVGEMEQIVVVC